MALRAERVAVRLCDLGPRVVAELLTAAWGDDAELWALAERFASLDPAVLRALGGDRFPPRCFAVEGGRRHG